MLAVHYFLVGYSRKEIERFQSNKLSSPIQPYSYKIISRKVECMTQDEEIDR